MTESVDRDGALRALDDVELRRRQIVDEIAVPRWYWWGLAFGWVALGVVAVVASPWVTVAATVAFGVVHSAVAARVIDGRHGSRELSVRSEVVNRHVRALVIGFLLVLVALTVVVAFVAEGLGVPQPALFASVVIAVTVLVGGPGLMAFVRHRAE